MELVNKINDAKIIIDVLKAKLSEVIIGHPDYVVALLIGLLTGKPIGATGVPGTAKTHGAKAMARLVGFVFKRIQFTSDLLPGDVTGNLVFNPVTGEWEFKPGAALAGMVLGDEVNRAPGRTHSGMLEIMEEKQVTIDGVAYPAPKGQLMILTYNPSESAGTEEVPDALNDRMIITVNVGHISEDDLVIMGQKYFRGELDYADEPIIDQDTIVELQKLTRQVASNANVLVFAYAAHIVAGSWEYGKFTQEAGERAFLALVHVGAALALMDGKAAPDESHIKEAAPFVLRHRLQLPFDSKKSIDDAIKELL